MSIKLTGKDLTLKDIKNFIYNFETIELDKEAIKKVEKCREFLEEQIALDKKIYGVTTGFGSFENVIINKKQTEQLQTNLIESHAVGAGEPMKPEFVRAMILLRANSLSNGYSGIRLETLKRLIEYGNYGITPLIPSQGSVGSSGDLVQLSHLARSLTGKGKAILITQPKNYKENIPSKNISFFLKKFNLEPLKLKAKEGLALINGTQMMSAYFSLAMIKLLELSKMADVIAAMSLDALNGSDMPFDLRIHKLRPHKGQLSTAKNILNLLKGSEIRKSHLEEHGVIQDAYSLRCIPQINGAVKDAISHTKKIIETEINSVTDNPLIFYKDGAYLSGGNFHGEPLALAADYLSIAASELGNISERRIDRMVNGCSYGLPKFLVREGGLNSGFMIVQYTAASLVSENKVLAHPASVDSIPTSANQEDHNSMGSIAVQKLFRIVQNLQSILTYELLTAAQALDFRKEKNNLRSGEGIEIAYKIVRKHIKYINNDRFLYEDFLKLQDIIEQGIILNEIEKKIKLLE